MNTKFEKSTKSTDEWYTPPEIIHSLGQFDLDPCTSIEAYNINHSARNFYTKEDDGLEKEWEGRVWLNPPYSRPLIELFIDKMAKHNNGIALVYNRCDSKMFQDVIFQHASAMLILEKPN